MATMFGGRFCRRRENNKSTGAYGSQANNGNQESISANMDEQVLGGFLGQIRKGSREHPITGWQERRTGGMGRACCAGVYPACVGTGGGGKLAAPTPPCMVCGL